jgi:hypothetical protein
MTRVVTRLVLVTVTALLGATLVTPPAGAAPTWRPITNLFADLSAAGGSAFTPAIGVDAAGDATVLWSRYNGTQYVVQASHRPVGGAWSAPVDLAGGRMIFDPQVVVDPAGNATAVWRRVDADRSVVQTSSRPAGGAWSAPVDLSTDPSVELGQRPDVPQVAVDGAGRVTATWSRFEAAVGQPWKFTVQSATRATDGTWSMPVDLSPAGSPARTTDVTVDPGRERDRRLGRRVDRPDGEPTRGRHLVGPRSALEHCRPSRQPARGRGPDRRGDGRLGQLRWRRLRRPDRVARARRRLVGSARPGDRGRLRHAGDRRRPSG